jgi:hypothetical protein
MKRQHQPLRERGTEDEPARLDREVRGRIERRAAA